MELAGLVRRRSIECSIFSMDLTILFVGSLTRSICWNGPRRSALGGGLASFGHIRRVHPKMCWVLQLPCPDKQPLNDSHGFQRCVSRLSCSWRSPSARHRTKQRQIDLLPTSLYCTALDLRRSRSRLGARSMTSRFPLIADWLPAFRRLCKGSEPMGGCCGWRGKEAIPE